MRLTPSLVRKLNCDSLLQKHQALEGPVQVPDNAGPANPRNHDSHSQTSGLCGCSAYSIEQANNAPHFTSKFPACLCLPAAPSQSSQAAFRTTTSFQICRGPSYPVGGEGQYETMRNVAMVWPVQLCMSLLTCNLCEVSGSKQHTCCGFGVKEP